MPDVIAKNLAFLSHGLALTLELTVLTMVGATALGIVAGTLRHFRVPALAQLAILYIEFIRGTPLLVVLLLTYFGLPALFGYKTDAFQAALFGFVLFSGAYIAEDFRSGLRSVHEGLLEAGLGLGLKRWQVICLIALPIAVRRVIPPVFGQYIRLLKFTSVASVIGVVELTGSALLVNAREFQPVTIIAFLALTYLAMCYGLSSLGRLLYARLAVQS